MDFSAHINDLLQLRAEIVLSFFILAILGVELFAMQNKKLLQWITLTGLVVTLFILMGDMYDKKLLFANSFGIPKMSIDPLGSFVKIIALLCTVFTVLFMRINFEDSTMYKRQGEFLLLLLSSLLGIFIISSSLDLILLYAGFELLSVSSYAMAGFYKNSFRSSESSLKYLLFGAAASAVMIYGISMLYGATGSLNLQEIKVILSNRPVDLTLLLLSVIFILAGIAFKISAFPFHFWTPDVYEGAPTHFTAYLSVASKIGGFIVLIRLLSEVFFISSPLSSDIFTPVTSLPWKDILIVLSIGSMTIGNLVALWQKNIKRLLAYSSIAHAGYMLAGLVAMSSTGMMAVLVYFSFYLIMNLGAFLVVILIKNEIKSEMLDDYNGLGAKLPLYAIALSIFLVSLTGLPPTAGFIGKFYILMALVNTNNIWLAFFVFLNSVISLYYYVRVMKHLFISKPIGEVPDVKQNWDGAALTLAFAIPTIVFGIFFTPVIKFAQAALKFYLP